VIIITKKKCVEKCKGDKILHISNVGISVDVLVKSNADWKLDN